MFAILLSFESHSHILDTTQSKKNKYSSQSVVCLFPLCYQCLSKNRCFHFCEAKFIKFLLYKMLWMSSLGSLCLTQSHRDAYDSFWSFVTCESLSHFCVVYVSKFIFLHVDVQLLQHHFLGSLPFLLSRLCVPAGTQFFTAWASFPGLYSVPLILWPNFVPISLLIILALRLEGS